MILLDTNVISEPQHRVSLHDNLDKRLLPMFANRVLSFDMACTKAYAELLAKCRSAGLAVETADAFIAAVALANGFDEKCADPAMRFIELSEQMNALFEAATKDSKGK